MKTYIEVTVCKSVQLDEYDKDYTDSADYGIIHTFKADTMNGALNIIKQYGEPYIFDNRLEVQVTENGMGVRPSHVQIEQWKQGKEKLYCVDYSFYLNRVTIKEIDNDDLVQSFPKLENNT